MQVPGPNNNRLSAAVVPSPFPYLPIPSSSGPDSRLRAPQSRRHRSPAGFSSSFRSGHVSFFFAGCTAQAIVDSMRAGDIAPQAALR